ncbi:hypothetical protein DV735_g3841, partial [Chaetothyriales sp. CBS 134920]
MSSPSRPVNPPRQNSNASGAATTVPPGPATSATPSIASAPATHDPDASPYNSHVVRRRPINIRRLPSGPVRGVSLADPGGSPGRNVSSRGRSTSAPQAPLDFTAGASYERLPGLHTGSGAQQRPDLSAVDESPILARQMVPLNTIHLTVPANEGGAGGGSGGRFRRSVGGSDTSMMSRRAADDPDAPRPHEYESEVVDLLDVIDPEVAALTTLTNVQNSLFVPDLGRWVNRRPTYTLSRNPSPNRKVPAPVPEEVEDQPLQEGEDELSRPATRGDYSWQRLERSHSISSEITDSHYAVLPHGLSLEGWSEEDKEALDDYVRHMLHSKRSKFKQIMKAFGKYMRTPLGFFVTLYATLITLFGLAWVLFLIGWIYAGSRQSYVVNVIDNVLVALFALMGDGLAPFRVVDTYHMIYIAHYHRLSWKLRQQRNLPELKNHNDLPTRFEKDVDQEAAEERADFIVLSRTQQKKLIHHQTKFSKSHTYYKPHETVTHHAFPIKLLILVVVMLDCHSVLQIMLGTFTWAWSYHTRPEWITSVILSFSITINVGAGVVIAIGDRITRKKDVVKRMTRQKVTQEAMKKVGKSKRVPNKAKAKKPPADKQADKQQTNKQPDTKTSVS